MAHVIGPNGHRTYVPDDVATSLVGDGNRGYAYAAEPEVPSLPAVEPPKRAPRKRATARKTD